jgi:hypothetical protein
MKDVLDGLNPMEKEEMKAAIANITNDPAITAAFEAVRENYINELTSEQVGSLTSHTLHASIKVLEAVKLELASMASAVRHTKMTRGN